MQVLSKYIFFIQKNINNILITLYFTEYLHITCTTIVIGIHYAQLHAAIPKPNHGRNPT